MGNNSIEQNGSVPVDEGVSDGLNWNPVDTIPMDGTEVLIRLPEGVVSAWFCNEPSTNDERDNGVYDWVCFDDMFKLDGYDNNIMGWLPFNR